MQHVGILQNTRQHFYGISNPMHYDPKQCKYTYTLQFSVIDMHICRIPWLNLNHTESGIVLCSYTVGIGHWPKFVNYIVVRCFLKSIFVTCLFVYMYVDLHMPHTYFNKSLTMFRSCTEKHIRNWEESYNVFLTLGSTSTVSFASPTGSQTDLKRIYPAWQ